MIGCLTRLVWRCSPRSANRRIGEKLWRRNGEISQQIEKTPGVGVATAPTAALGDGKTDGRQSLLKLAPRQDGTGGKVRLGLETSYLCSSCDADAGVRPVRRKPLRRKNRSVARQPKRRLAPRRRAAEGRRVFVRAGARSEETRVFLGTPNLPRTGAGESETGYPGETRGDAGASNSLVEAGPQSRSRTSRHRPRPHVPTCAAYRKTLAIRGHPSSRGFAGSAASTVPRRRGILAILDEPGRRMNGLRGLGTMRIRGTDARETKVRSREFRQLRASFSRRSSSDPRSAARASSGERQARKSAVP